MNKKSLRTMVKPEFRSSVFIFVDRQHLRFFVKRAARHHIMSGRVPGIVFPNRKPSARPEAVMYIFDCGGPFGFIDIVKRHHPVGQVRYSRSQRLGNRRKPDITRAMLLARSGDDSRRNVDTDNFAESQD